MKGGNLMLHGNEKREQQLSAGIGAGAGGVVAILMKVLEGG